MLPELGSLELTFYSSGKRDDRTERVEEVRIKDEQRHVLVGPGDVHHREALERRIVCECQMIRNFAA